MTTLDENQMFRQQQEEIVKSLQKRFRKCLFSKFMKAITDYELIKPNDKIAVCISGGKDSMLMAAMFKELLHFSKIPFSVEYLVMDPGYASTNRKMIEENSKKIGIEPKIFKTDIFDKVYDIDKSPCYLCARMRRGHLYSQAEQLGCNKIALGHHYDDVIETILMGLLYGGQFQTMMPKLHSTNFTGMELIRPLYLIRESDIMRWRDANNLTFLQCACRFTENYTDVREDGSVASKRVEVKNLIALLKETNPFIESNLFRSVEKVNLDTIVSYKSKGEIHHFLDGYDEI